MPTHTINIEIPNPPIPTGNTLWVDAVNGDDGTAVSGRQDLPFATLVAARDEAVSGDLIVVRPGTYEVDEAISKDGVNWHFENGAIVTMTTDDNVSIFDDTAGAQSYTVSGYGYFERGETSQPLEYANVIHMEQSGSVVVVYCDTILNTANEKSIDIGDPGTAAIFHGNGTLTVHARNIEAQSHAYYWEVGNAWINADTIIANGNANDDGDGVVCKPPEGNADNVFVRAHSITSAKKSAVYSSASNSYAPDFRLWVISEAIIGGQYGIQAVSGKVYVTAQKISVTEDGATVIGSIGDPGNELYVTAQKAGVADSLDTLTAFTLVTSTDGKTRISCLEWVMSPVVSWSYAGGLFNVSSVNELDFECSDGTIIIPAAITTPIIAASASSGGGKRVFKNMRLYSTAPTTPDAPVVLTDGLTILQNCTIETAASVSIDADAHHSVTCHASYANKAADSNVTIVGGLSTDLTKNTPVDADTVDVEDSAASKIRKKLSWANIKATLLAYFDTLYPRKNTLIDTAFMVGPSGDNWLNQPAALTFFNGQTRWVMPKDLTLCTEAQIHVLMGGAGGVAGAKLRILYRTQAAGYSTTITDYATVCTGELQVTFGTSTSVMLHSGWLPLVAGAKAPVILAVAGIDGNGVADPAILSVCLETR